VKCVKKQPNKPSEIIECNHPGDIIKDVLGISNYSRFNQKLQICYDDNFVAKKLERNIVHPCYQSYYELCGTVVVCSSNEMGHFQELTQREATQCCIALDELANLLRGPPYGQTPRLQLRSLWPTD